MWTADKAMDEKELIFHYYETLFNNHPEGICLLDLQGTIIKANDAASLLLGRSFDHLKGAFHTYLSDEFQGSHQACFSLAVKGQIQHYKSMTIHFTSEKIYLNITYIPIVHHSNIIGVYAIVRNTTDLLGKESVLQKSEKVKWLKRHMFPSLNAEGERRRIDSTVTNEKELEAKLTFLANHDYLTSLPNRKYFREKFDEILKKAEKNETQFAVIHLDLDRFKHINDTLNTRIGDKLLQQAAHRLNQLVEKETGFIARTGGDEFIILWKCDGCLEHASSFVQMVIEAICQPFFIDSYEIEVTASIGMSIYPTDGQDTCTLLARAGQALTKAKEEGKNTFKSYKHQTAEYGYNVYDLEKEMKTALKHHEFTVYYQPRIETQSGKINSAEALIRWNHPDKGFLSPGIFLPIAEESDLIIDIDDWVLEKVCCQLNEWKQDKIPLVPISVNISAKRFYKSNWEQSIQQLLNHYEIEPGFIELEITETSFIHNDETIAVSLEKLRKMGIKIALDDFGTGYSSLRYLKKLKIDTIKIDRSFIENTPEHKENATITSSIIAMSKALGLLVVAEGVETAEQVEFLQKQNCDELQGFLFSKPVPSHDWTNMLMKQDKSCENNKFPRLYGMKEK